MAPQNIQSQNNQGVILGLSAVVVAVQDHEPKVFIVRDGYEAALPFGPFEPDRHPTLELGLRSWVKEQTPLEPGYVEQLYTFGNRGRYAGLNEKSRRVISVGYLALTYHEKTEKMSWSDWYDYFPWEDWRKGKPKIVDEMILPSLAAWIDKAKTPAEKNHRKVRAQMCFGMKDKTWDDEKVLERYELLYEARLVLESLRDHKMTVEGELVPGKSMLYDHRRILATAMGRLRGKLKYRPVVFELMPAEFTLLELQKTVEAIAGHGLHKQNFRRLVENSGMVEEIKGKSSKAAGGRPAALFRFRKDVILERPAPGMRLSPAQNS